MSPSPEQLARRARRSVVSEEALFVSPDLLGLPLASPWRRGGAIAIDGILVSLLANAPSVLFGLAAAYVLFRVSGRGKVGAGYVRRSFRLFFRVGAALVLFGVAVSLWDSVGDRFRSSGNETDEGGVRASIEVEEEGGLARELNLTGLEAVQFGADVVTLHTAENEEEAREAAVELLGRLRAGGLSGADARNAVRDIATDTEARPWLAEAVADVLEADAAADQSAPGATEDNAEVEPDSLIVAYAAAISGGDSARVDSLRPEVVALLSRDTVGVLADAITSLGDERARLETRVEELEEEVEEGPGLMVLLRSFIEDMGLGLGWFGLYFTATTAMWHGRTPGKRVFGIRVISLTGKPIGWWAAFERFGGYAAGFATGLLGFLQIFWDDNRQAIHDKIAVTVVIRE